jgi:hypothetical protein
VLPGPPRGALSTLCNAGPLSLSAYPQSSTSQTTDTATSSSVHAQLHLPSTTSPTPLTPSFSTSPDGPPYPSWIAVPFLPFVALQRNYLMPASTVLPRVIHSLSPPLPAVSLLIPPPSLSALPTGLHRCLNVKGLLLHRCLTSPCRAVWSPDSLPPMYLTRDECCRGLPGDALCVPCNADPLSLSATPHKTAYQTGSETVLPLLMPQNECCRGLPGGALSTLCNAGPLSLSTYPQSSTSQTADTTMPSSSNMHSHLSATTNPITWPSYSLSTPRGSLLFVPLPPDHCSRHASIALLNIPSFPHSQSISSSKPAGALQT